MASQGISTELTITRHREDKQSKASIFFFPIKMIAKLERAQSNAQLNMERTQNPKMGATLKNESTAAKPLALERTAA